jgi:hypothetical protein
MQKIEFVTVKQMLDFVQTNDTPLLSSFDADFWREYVANHEYYDKVFARLYKNFYYFNQDANDTKENVTPDFITDVYGLLMANRKRYSELYRINLVDDEQYSIIDNYDVTETIEKTDSKTDSIEYGQKVTSREDQHDLTDTYGNRQTTNNSTVGAQQNTSTEKVAPYDSEDFSNNTQSTVNLGSRSDNSTTQQAAATDTHNTTIEGSVTEGTHTDARTVDGTAEQTLHRKGNIGVQTQSEVMEKHARFWRSYSFYKIVFEDICRELLLIDNAYI